MGYRVYLCGGPRCSARRSELALALERAIRDAGLEGEVDVRIGGCLGRCERGPNLIVHPGGSVYVGLRPDAVRLIVEQHLCRHAPCAAFLDPPPV